MKKNKCKKSFYVDKYDDDGFLIENDGMVIEEGKIYELNESEYMMITSNSSGSAKNQRK